MIIRNLQQDIFIHDELKSAFKTLEEKSYMFVQGYCFKYRGKKHGLPSYKRGFLVSKN